MVVLHLEKMIMVLIHYQVDQVVVLALIQEVQQMAPLDLKLMVV